MKKIELTAGSHVDADDGMCLLEAVSVAAGEPWSDSPQCACSVAAAFGRVLNDAPWSSSAARTAALLPLRTLLIGSVVSPEATQRRRYYLADRAVREAAPIALRAAGLCAEPRGGPAPRRAALRAAARWLASPPEIVDASSAHSNATYAHAAAAAADAGYDHAATFDHAAAAAAAAADSAAAAARAARAAAAADSRAYAAAGDFAARAYAAASHAAYAHVRAASDAALVKGALTLRRCLEIV